MENNAKLAKAVRIVIENLKADDDYRMSWVANIAVTFQDHVSRYKKANKKRELNRADIHKISNESAEAFLKTLCR